jgi:hypothetical protein
LAETLSPLLLGIDIDIDLLLQKKKARVLCKDLKLQPALAPRCTSTLQRLPFSSGRAGLQIMAGTRGFGDSGNRG